MRIIIVGAGGQGRIVADAIRASAGELVIAGFVDDRADLEGTLVDGIRVVGGVKAMADTAHDAIVVAIGDNARRQVVTERLEAQGERLMTVRHPFSSIAPTAQIGPGCMISAGVVVTPGARIGRGVLLNTSCCVEHDTIIGDYVHVSFSAAVGAACSIGTRSLIGLSAAVMTGRKVGADTTVGAGALVSRDLPDGVVAVGVPARVRSSR